MTGVQVAQALERAKVERGKLPASLTVDNGTEFSSRALEAWVMSNDVQLCFIRPGCPVENRFIESFNGRLRDECLNVEWFVSLHDARLHLAKFRQHYNHEWRTAPWRTNTRDTRRVAQVCDKKSQHIDEARSPHEIR